jgi:type VI secretion system protein
MTLRLSVVSEHGIRLGAQSTKVFAMHGGTLGRGADNAWILPDPERYLSGKHARIEFRAGSYLLVDLSSNGTYLNGSRIPLEKEREYLLADGDHVRLGKYELLVTIDPLAAAAEPFTDFDLAADLDLSRLLEPSDAVDLPGDLSGDLPAAPQGDADARPKQAARGAAAPGEMAPPADDRSSGAGWDLMTRPFQVMVPAKPAAMAPAKAAPKPPAKAASKPAAKPVAAAAAGMAAWMSPEPTAPASAPTPVPVPTLFDDDLDAGLAAFCRGAGIDPRAIAPEARAAALQLAGQLLRESAVGLLDLNQNRIEFHSRFRIQPAPDEATESPLNFARGVEHTLVRLLSGGSRSGPVEAVRDNFRQLKAQNVATVAALRAAFEDFVERLAPKELEERFERGAKRGVFGQNKAKYWDLYAGIYSSLAQRPADGFPHLFAEAFAKAYATKLRTLIPPRRGAFGIARHDSAARDEPPAPDRHAAQEQHTAPDDRAVGDS